ARRRDSMCARCGSRRSPAGESRRDYSLRASGRSRALPRSSTSGEHRVRFRAGARLRQTRGMTSGRGAELPSGAPAPSGTKSVLAALLLVGLTALAYAPALEGGFIWDDDAYVYENPTLRSAAGLRAIWLDPTANKQYYPLV